MWVVGIPTGRPRRHRVDPRAGLPASGAKMRLDKAAFQHLRCGNENMDVAQSSGGDVDMLAECPGCQRTGPDRMFRQSIPPSS
jgi:DNA replicative helicase MCM subunit Mcm2 (Cdc46/Mcm family)